MIKKRIHDLPMCSMSTPLRWNDVSEINLLLHCLSLTSGWERRFDHFLFRKTEQLFCITN